MEEKLQHSVLSLDPERLINGNDVGSTKFTEINNNQKIKENPPKSNFYKYFGIISLVIVLLVLTTGLCIFFFLAEEKGISFCFGF